MKLRDYQERAVASVRRAWSHRQHPVCLVAPTGSGKTIMGEALVDSAAQVVWLAHRREIIHQTVRRLRARFGTQTVGVLMGDEPTTPRARIQVATVQTLLARDTLPKADALMLDECHHFMAADWRAVVDRMGASYTVGLTATPERGDGQPLGDIFGELVVAANYSELIRDGYLVPAHVYQPPQVLGDDLAQDPVDAWFEYSRGTRSFVFCARVVYAYDTAQRFRDLGVRAETVEANTPKRERDEILRRFSAGHTMVLTNCNTLTEGVDVPAAATCVLARAFGHIGGYLQTAGRVLRPAPGKEHATIIDLTGATIVHGPPTTDREYSLGERPISGSGNFGGSGGGPSEFSQDVLGMPLRSVGGVAAPEPIKPEPVDESERRDEYRRLLALTRQHGFRDGFAAVKYREKYGEEPMRKWV